MDRVPEGCPVGLDDHRINLKTVIGRLVQFSGDVQWAPLLFPEPRGHVRGSDPQAASGNVPAPSGDGAGRSC